MKKVGVFNGHLEHITAFLAYLIAIRYNFPRFGKLYQEKSGNPGQELAGNIRLIKFHFTQNDISESQAACTLETG
jgi:hypothetical protein